MFFKFTFFVFALIFTAAIFANHDLVNIKDTNASILIEMKYATEHNFTKKKIYTQAKCYLRKEVAEKLNKVQKELEKMGLGLKICDGYRPLSAQKILWQLVPNERYVANPVKGSKHNRGAAIDLTIVDKKGKELQMPTEFDNFTEKAHRNYKNLSSEALKNRKLLQELMEKHGFIGLESEWWHFDDCSWQKYDILDIPFEKL